MNSSQRFFIIAISTVIIQIVISDCTIEGPTAVCLNIDSDTNLNSDTRKAITKIVFKGQDKGLTLIEETFKDFYNVRKLIFDTARIQDIQQGAFKPLVNLEKFIFKKSIIKQFEYGVFSDLEQVKTLVINQVRWDKTTNTELTNIWLKDFPNLQFLDIKLRYIELSHNPIEEIDLNHILKTNTKLSAINLKHLPCETIKKNKVFIDSNMSIFGSLDDVEKECNNGNNNIIVKLG
ncbi:uncharacterized protein LOC123292542 [Chrysoperla carnea]|uniref:uncharacterized protein LOC123292542 n=1 Tax=Chrysoperla carnea TaxID=189513 RepID=UPI001D087D09|nr:uncharacterized protein LOC123292542 [Chrysoperla carnea]